MSSSIILKTLLEVGKVLTFTLFQKSTIGMTNFVLRNNKHRKMDIHNKSGIIVPISPFKHISGYV